MRTARTIAAGAMLWCLAFVLGVALNYLGLLVAAGSITFLALRAVRCMTQQPTDRIGAVVLALAAAMFAVSLFLPLWGHTGFGSSEEEGRVPNWHHHSLFELDHIH